MALPVEYNLQNNGGGATGFSSRVRGEIPRRDETPIVTPTREGGDRTIEPRRSIGRRTVGTLADVGRSIASRGPITRRPTTAALDSSRSVATSGSRLSRGGGILSSEPYTPPPAPTVPSSIFPFIGRPGGSPFIGPTNVAPGITIMGWPKPDSNVGQNAGVDQPPSPLDARIEDLFRGFFNEPVRGGANKSGEFVYIPPASGGGRNSGMLFLILAGVGVLGFIAYRKFAGGS